MNSVSHLSPQQVTLVQQTLPELAADLENAYFSKDLRVTLSTAVQSSLLEVVMTIFNSVQRHSFCAKVNIKDSSAVILGVQDHGLKVDALEDVVDQFHLAVDRTVAVW